MEKYRAIPEGYMRIGEMAKKAGITERTLRYYDKEGLLAPSAESDAGYRLYTDKDMVKLVQILMMKELGFPLGEIKKLLARLDTPEDVIKMLTQQMAHMREKIKALTESLAAMEALKDEIAQMETVNFRKYSDILLNLQIKSKAYWMIKHFDDEVMDSFSERIGRKKAALMADALYHVSLEAIGLIEKGLTPEGEQGQAFAAKFWATLMDFSGGDMTKLRLLEEQIDNALDKENNITGWKEDAKLRDTIYIFMKRSLELYHGTQNERGSYG